jgi:GNAT superfamily N-acetyltransferase
MKVRHIDQSELPQLLSLLQAKAEFDGCPESLLATTESLRDALFSANPQAHALVVEINGQLVGMATYYTIFSSFIAKPGLWLDDLYVYEEYRGQRIGLALMQQLCKIAEQAGCGRVDWHVSKFNEHGKNFYRKIGATISEVSQLVRLETKAIQNLASS